ncbi:response regulator transcription factor [Litoribacter alkaliphilus]|uniref:Response regulator transcription factor n=1 Tax=Litoribacter ruber TaxID=702568 RepID=A0AAP2G0W6_9BACT|nr:LytTR family DNA-binding domain-containing protein [Litoribacter alkaliphilus]MBS9523594.1 response regulator transcription factor [Litoribacter alkaliphilus]
MNNLIECLIIDDEPYAQEIIEEYIKKIPFLKLLKKSNDAVEGLNDIEELKPDLVFMDIEMPEMNGLDLIRILRQHRPEIILTTAYSEHALEGFELEVTDYLLKPIPFDRFVKAVNKAKKNLQPAIRSSSSPTYFWAKENGKLIYVPFEEVQVVKGMKDYVQIYLNDRKIITYQTLKRIMEILPESDFIRVHKSYIVKKSCIKAIEGNSIETTIGEEIIIGGAYRGAIIKEINGWLR